MVVGSVIATNGGNQHPIRWQPAFRTLVAHSSISESNGGMSAGAFRGRNSQMVFAHNTWTSGRAIGFNHGGTFDGPHHIMWEGNRFNRVELNSMGGSHFVLRNNTAWNMPALIKGFEGTGDLAPTDFRIYNNSVYADAGAAGWGAGRLVDFDSANGLILRNNLVMTSPDSPVNDVYIRLNPSKGPIRGVVSDHNVFFIPSDTDGKYVRYNWTYYTLADWQAAGFGTGSTVGVDPQVLSVDRTSEDYLRPGASSPLIDAGAFTPVRGDHDGVARPIGGGWDIGAYEWQPAALEGDANGDGVVDDRDLSILLSHWGQEDATPDQGDLNADGRVDDRDLSILLGHWGDGMALGSDTLSSDGLQGDTGGLDGTANEPLTQMVPILATDTATLSAAPPLAAPGAQPVDLLAPLTLRLDTVHIPTPRKAASPTQASTLAPQLASGKSGYRPRVGIDWDALLVLRELDSQLSGDWLRH